uniref:Uncharacterized protein n=1 Tax=Glossina palpalis gambiensis TaxID=67801 RepID=A0A1B0B9Q7_9MUSC
MKNCDPFVLRPALAIESIPGPVCLSSKFSSSNLGPKIDLPPVPSTIGFDLFDDVHAIDDLAENNVFVVQPGSLNSTNKKLRTIGIRSGIGHRQDAGASMLQSEIFISEFVAINRFAAGAIVICEIAALAHEIGNDAMEGGAFITETFFTSA